MTADAYLKHHSHKQCHITTDPLTEILSNITKNPGAYTTKQTTSDKEQSNTKQKRRQRTMNIIAWKQVTPPNNHLHKL